MAINNSIYDFYNLHRQRIGIDSRLENKIEDSSMKQTSRFANLFRARVNLTDERIVRYGSDPISSMMAYDYDLPRKEDIDEIIQIKMAKKDYEYFMHHFEYYMDIADNLDDPVIQDMLNQLIMMVRLKK